MMAECRKNAKIINGDDISLVAGNSKGEIVDNDRDAKMWRYCIVP